MAAGWIEVPGHGLVNLDLVRSIEWTTFKRLKLVFDPNHSVTLDNREDVLSELCARILNGVPARLIDGGPSGDDGKNWWDKDPGS